MSFKQIASTSVFIDPDVSALQPPLGIEDPATRMYLMSLTAAWNERNGIGGSDLSKKFLTRGEVMQESLAAVGRVFAQGVDGTQMVGDVPTSKEINDTISNLQDAIRKSLIYQALEIAIGDINLSNITAQIDAALGSAYAAVANETTTRVSKDNAMASSILTIWASIGNGTTGIIQDGQLASVTPTAVTATKWNQVVASVTDPNTGLVNSTSIKQDLNVYSSANNSTLNAIYSVRVQLDIGGSNLIVGGFGLSATSGAGSAQGPSIDFGVRADKFFIAATSATPNGTTQENMGNSIPFMVLTSPQSVNGIPYAAGVFIKTATIGDATIGTAKIVDAAITNLKIGSQIYSDNYFPSGGTVGWYIAKDGTATFQNIYARGNIQATSITTDTIYAENVVSDSLNQFFTTLAGTFSFTVSVGAKAIRLSCTPGVYASGGGGGKDGTEDLANRQVALFIDGVGQTQAYIVGAGSCYWYGVSAGTHTLTVVNTSPLTGLFTGRIYVDVIAR